MSTVLVLQSDAELIDIWRVTLESSGHRVLVAPSSAKGVALVRDGGIDAVVVDSGNGGPELNVLVDALARLPDALPLILVSDSPDSPEVSARVGAAAFLPKPCSPGELDAVVRRIIGAVPASELSDEPTQPRPIPRP